MSPHSQFDTFGNQGLDDRERRLLNVITEPIKQDGHSQVRRNHQRQDAAAQFRTSQRVQALAALAGNLPLDLLRPRLTFDLRWYGDRPVIQQCGAVFIGASHNESWSFQSGKLQRYQRGELVGELRDGLPETLSADDLQRLMSKADRIR